MRAPILLAVFALSEGALAEAPGFVREAVERSSPGARATIVEYRETLQAGCSAIGALAVAPPDLSGRLTLRLTGRSEQGRSCDGFASARAELLAPVWVVVRPIAAGAPLGDAIVREERPVQGIPGRVNDLTEGAVAARALTPGTILEERLVRSPGPRPGETVPVVLRSGEISITQNGRLTPCLQGRSCATLPTGKRVEGRLVDGRLIVEAP